MDESGTPPGQPNPKKPYFTLGAVVIKAEDWQSVHDKVLGFRLRHHLRGELKWRFFAPHNSSPDNPMLHLSPPERRELSAEFSGLISDSPVTIIACVVDVAKAFEFPSVTNQQQLYHFTYKPITERFQYFLQDVNGLGIIVSDHRGRDSDKMLRAHHETLTGSRGNTRSGYDRLIEGLFLQDSQHSTGIQLADFVAGAIHRAYAAGDGSHAKPLRSRIRSDASGNIQGRGLILHPKASFRSGLG